MSLGKLSEYERLSLINQFEILAKLSNEEHEKKDYQLRSKILEEGYVNLYDHLTDFFSEQMSVSDSQFVHDVLNFYEDVHNSYEKLSDDEKDENLKYHVTFKGFDLNDPKQAKLYSYADFMINDFNRWHYLKNLIDAGEVELNSHGSEVNRFKLEGYIKSWKLARSLRKTSEAKMKPLTKQELVTIFM